MGESRRASIDGGDKGRRRLIWRNAKQIALQMKDELSNDHLSIVSAGCAFYAILALFPAMAAIVSIYGLVSDPTEVEAQFALLQGILPEQAYTLLMRQLSGIASSASSTLSWSLALSVALVIWSANKGSRTMFKALNIVYDVKETRGIILLNAQTLCFTAGALVGLVAALAVIVAVPVAFSLVGLGSAIETVIGLARWPLLAALLIVALAILYRFGPYRRNPGWRWLLPGAVAATVLWIAGSILFSMYIARFGSYEQTFGSLGAVIILLLWLYLSAYVVLLGGELNVVLERLFRGGASDDGAAEASPRSEGNAAMPAR